MTRLTPIKRSKELDLGTKESDRCRSFFAMGLVVTALRSCALIPTLRYIDEKFGKKPKVAEANRRAHEGRLPLRRNGPRPSAVVSHLQRRR